MPRGGARNRSGPSPDENSLESARKGLVFTALPADGYAGGIPDFPLPRMIRRRWEYEDKRRYQVFDEEMTELYRDREEAIWESEWRTPQAAAWATQSWRWTVIAEYCRLKTVVEQEPDSSASLVAQLHRYRDQIGLTPAGLKENGWKVGPASTPSQPETPPAPARTSTRSRLKVVPSADKPA